MAKLTDVHPCPKCGAPGLQYLINLDCYQCKYCGRGAEVLEVEPSHVMYQGPVDGTGKAD